jgi:hypothetical protein
VRRRSTRQLSIAWEPRQVRAADDRSRRGLLAGLIFGIILGFLLKKGGVGKFHILIGQLLLLDWTVVKVMAARSSSAWSTSF